MKTYKQIIFTASIFFVVSVKPNANIKERCPSGNWNLRAKSYCSTVEQYTCLFDSIRNIYKENCNGPKTEPPGDKTVVNSGNFDTESCSFDRFQPFSYSTSQGNDCIYEKTICSEEGQLIYSNGSSRYDRKCRCDYTKHFSFVSAKRVDMCSCDPTNEDCTCYIKLCGKGHILTPDYQCVQIEESYGNFVCEDIKFKSNQTAVGKSYGAKRTNTEEFVGKNEKGLEVLMVVMVGITILGLLCMCLLLPVAERIAKSFNAKRCQKTQQCNEDTLKDNDRIDGNRRSIIYNISIHGIEDFNYINEQPGMSREQNHSRESLISTVICTSATRDLTRDITHTEQIEASTELLTEFSKYDIIQLKDQTIVVDSTANTKESNSYQMDKKNRRNYTTENI